MSETTEEKIARLTKLLNPKQHKLKLKPTNLTKPTNPTTKPNKVPEPEHPNFIELCAGAGGLSSGFINKGFKPLFLNDYDKYSCETLRLNHPSTNVIQKSMLTIDHEFAKYPKNSIDIIMGGVPCQSFSQAGKRKGLTDERGNLLLEFLKIVFKYKPKVFIIENVKGLLNHNKGLTFELIQARIKKNNKYNFQFQVLNANDYDVPQKRERLIMVGTRKDFMNNNSKNKTAKGKTAKNKTFTYPTPSAYKPVLKDVLTNVPQSEGQTYPSHKKKVLSLVPAGGCWVNLPPHIQQSYMGAAYHSTGGRRGMARRLSMDEPSLTLTTSPAQKQTERCHPTETRPLTTREYARIQTFPDSYKFFGSMSQVYRQIGNAVPVKLSEAIATEIKKLF